MVDRAAQRQTEGNGNGLGNGLLTSVLPRQLWRPPATQTAVSLLSKITGRTGLMLHRPEQLSEWYEQFTQRLQPWSKWSRLSMELRSDANPLGGETHKGRFLTEGASGEVKSQKSKVKSHDSQRNFVIVTPLPSRPAVRLAILRSTPKTPEAAPRREVNQPLGLPLISGNRFSPASREERAPALDAAPLHFRLLLSVSSAPRQEIRGGFPHQASPLIGLPIAEPTSNFSKLHRATLNHTAAEVPPMEVTRWSTPPATPFPPSAIPTPDPLSASADAIAKLIEQTSRPEKLPGLQLRLAPPVQQPVAPLLPNVINGSQQATNGVTPSSSGPASHSPPQRDHLDINAVADQVYQKLQRRQQFEQERRGLY